MLEYDLLANQIEGAFGDQEDEEGLPVLIEQLEAYPQLAPRILASLQLLASSGDPERCYDLVTTYAHRSPASPQEAVEWVRNLHTQVTRR